jgi:UDP-2,3-diacylglucosamine hydrolase
MTKPDFIASDVHLGAVPRETERRFTAFLEHAGEAARTLIVAGDLFDFWFEYGEVVPGRHFRVLAALSRVVDAGVPVTLLGGNHDYWGGRFLEEEVGVRFEPQSYRTELGGRPALVVHGDGLGGGDLKYRLLKRVLRSRLTIGAFRALHPEVGVRIARAVSSTEAKAAEPLPPGRGAFLAGWAAERLRAEPVLGWVVCGHSHDPAVTEVEPGRYYLNAGDWVRNHTYITVTPAGVPTLRHWSGERSGAAIGQPRR